MTNPYLQNTSQRQLAPWFPEQRMLEEKIECKLQAGNKFLSELSAMLPTCQLLPLWKAETRNHGDSGGAELNIKM